jgi:hypothetical protein
MQQNLVIICGGFDKSHFASRISDEMRMLAISETKPSYSCIVEMKEFPVDNRRKCQFYRIG